MRTPEPHPLRVAAVILATGTALVPLVGAGRWAGTQDSAVAACVSILAGVAAMLLVGSIGEWVVHRYAMHGGRRFPLFRVATELHHRAHHWVHFRPDRYVHSGPVEYPSVLGGRSAALAGSRAARVLTVAAHAGFYGLFATPIVGTAWLATGNPWFTVTVAGSGIVLIALFIRVHDAVHYPGTSRLERFAWFWFLDHHHYIHHIDNRANTNFLLPLGDLLMGTLRLELTAAELERWPSYAEARRRLHDPQSGPGAGDERARAAPAPRTIVADQGAIP